MIVMWLAILGMGVDAGPALPSCDQSVVTLAAEAIDPPANYVIQWEGQPEPGVFLTVMPTQTTSYRVFLTDLDTMDVFEDTVRVLVAPDGSDLNGDTFLDIADWYALYNAWGAAPAAPEFDPDGDELVTILDWFWICNFDDVPPNTPPRITIEENLITYQNQTLNIMYAIEDDEQTPVLLTSDPLNGSVFLLGGELRYNPDKDYVGLDSF